MEASDDLQYTPTDLSSESTATVLQRFPGAPLETEFNLGDVDVQAPVLVDSGAVKALFPMLRERIDAFNREARELNDLRGIEIQHTSRPVQSAEVWNRHLRDALVPWLASIEEGLNQHRRGLEGELASLKDREGEKKKRQIALQERKAQVGVPKEWVGKNPLEELAKSQEDYQRGRAALEENQRKIAQADPNREEALQAFRPMWSDLQQEWERLNRIETELRPIVQEDGEIEAETARISEARNDVAQREGLLDQIGQFCRDLRDELSKEPGDESSEELREAEPLDQPQGEQL